MLTIFIDEMKTLFFSGRDLISNFRMNPFSNILSSVLSATNRMLFLEFNIGHLVFAYSDKEIYLKLDFYFISGKSF